MSKSIKKLRVHRKFSEEFKESCVRDYEKGLMTVQELSSSYSIASTVLYRWIHKYSAYSRKNRVIVEEKDSKTVIIKDLQKRIADLERAVGQKQLHNDFLEKMIELAEQEYNISIKKNSSTPPSVGSKKATRK